MEMKTDASQVPGEEDSYGTSDGEAWERTYGASLMGVAAVASVDASYAAANTAKLHTAKSSSSSQQVLLSFHLPLCKGFSLICTATAENTPGKK